MWGVVVVGMGGWVNIRKNTGQKKIGDKPRFIYLIYSILTSQISISNSQILKFSN